VSRRRRVTVIGRTARARNAGRAIVDEAARRDSETVDFVLKHATCRVMVAAGTPAA